MCTKTKTITGLAIICILIIGFRVHADSILYATDTDTDKLYEINRTSASATEVGTFGVPGYMAGLAYDSGNSVMYGTTTGTDKLYSINLSTGNAAFIGDLGAILMHGLAYDNSTETLFGTFGISGGDGLYNINVTTGDSTLIGHIGHFYDFNQNTVTGLAIHPFTDDLYGVIGGPTSVSALVRINKTTGAGILLHEFTIPNMAGLAFDPSGVLYATDNWSGNLYSLDISSGATTFIGDTGLGNTLGLAAIPEPASLAMIGLFSGGIWFMRRYQFI